MKKTQMNLSAVLLGLVFLATFLIGAQTINAQSVEPENHFSSLKIFSPSNTTYNSNSLLLNVSIHRQFKPTEYNSRIMYSLNGENNVTVPSSSTFFDMTTPDSIWSSLMSYSSISGIASLQNLSEGYHFLTVFGIYERAQGISTKYPAIMHDVESVYFTINYGVAPSLSNLQIENKTYNQNNLPLNITIDKKVSWIGYSLNGQANITFTQNMTLNELAYGSHSLEVYANDTLGNMGATGKINFIIEKNESFPTIPVAAVFIAVAILIVTYLLVYHKKNKRLAFYHHITIRSWNLKVV